MMGRQAALLSVVVTVIMTVVVEGKRPFDRMQQTTGQGESKGSTYTGPSVAYLQSVMREGGTDPIEALSMAMNSPGYKALLGNSEIQHRILEEMPLLRAFKPFKDIADRQANSQDTMSGFAEGMKQAFEFMKDAFVKIKDPNVTVDTLTKLAKSEDPTTQDVFRRARGGEKAAVEELQRLFTQEQFPGVDIDVLKEVAANHNFDKLLGMDEVMRFIDRDQALSDVFRKPFPNPYGGDATRV